MENYPLNDSEKTESQIAKCALVSKKCIFIVLGSFAPAGPHTIWKKRVQKENNETTAYQALMNDVISDVIPKFYREVEYNGYCILNLKKYIYVLSQVLCDFFCLRHLCGNQSPYFLSVKLHLPIVMRFCARLSILLYTMLTDAKCTNELKY